MQIPVSVPIQMKQITAIPFFITHRLCCGSSINTQCVFPQVVEVKKSVEYKVRGFVFHPLKYEMPVTNI